MHELKRFVKRFWEWLGGWCPPRSSKPTGFTQ